MHQLISLFTVLFKLIIRPERRRGTGAQLPQETNSICPPHPLALLDLNHKQASCFGGVREAPSETGLFPQTRNLRRQGRDKSEWQKFKLRDYNHGVKAIAHFFLNLMTTNLLLCRICLIPHHPFVYYCYSNKLQHCG